MNPLKLLTILVVSIWVGAMIFFSAFVAPTAFSVLERESAGRLVSTVFPKYYLFGLVLGIIAFGAIVGRVLVQGRGMPWGPLVLLLLMLGMNLFTLLVLLPQLHAARSAVPGASVAFARLHFLSVLLNVLTMLAGLTLVFVDGLRARP